MRWWNLVAFLTFFFFSSHIYLRAQTNVISMAVSRKLVTSITEGTVKLYGKASKRERHIRNGRARKANANLQYECVAVTTVEKRKQNKYSHKSNLVHMRITRYLRTLSHLSLFLFLCIVALLRSVSFHLPQFTFRLHTRTMEYSLWTHSKRNRTLAAHAFDVTHSLIHSHTHTHGKAFQLDRHADKMHKT